MSSYYVPVYLVVEASSPAEAVRQKQAVETLLNNPLVSSMLQANGVSYTSIQVAAPTPVQAPALTAKR